MSIESAIAIQASHPLSAPSPPTFNPFGAGICGLVVQNLLPMETQVPSLGWEDPLEKEMATHSSIPARGNPMDRGAWGLQTMGLQRVGHNLRG